MVFPVRSSWNHVVAFVPVLDQHRMALKASSDSNLTDCNCVSSLLGFSLSKPALDMSICRRVAFGICSNSLPL